MASDLREGGDCPAGSFFALEELKPSFASRYAGMSTDAAPVYHSVRKVLRFEGGEPDVCKLSWMSQGDVPIPSVYQGIGPANGNLLEIFFFLRFTSQ